MTNPTLERAARALAFVTADHKHTSDQWWDGLIDSEKEAAVDMARAVLMAVREPDEDMLTAGCEVGPDTNSGCFNFEDGKTVFTAMIDAILAEGE